MSRWGELDNKKVIHILDEGCSYLIGSLKDKSINVDSAWNQYENLKDLLYGDGRYILSISNAAKFEKRLKSVKKILEELER